MIAKRQMPVYIDGPTNVIDVRDVAIAHINAADRGRIGERYIVGNWNTSLKALNELIAKVAGVPAPKVPVPFSIARFGSKLVDRGRLELFFTKNHPFRVSLSKCSNIFNTTIVQRDWKNWGIHRVLSSRLYGNR
jgi:dihydroflavonol-4-reductase